MTINDKLGAIEKVELATIWPNEATDFTPWLEENIAMLGDALGMDLAVRGREAPVGAFHLDLLANDGSGRTVVIENQLRPTDHSHLGQLLTYMAGFDANVIVWIASEFRDEHAEALSLLNRRTGEDTEFFGVEIQLWRIGESLPGPHFNLVAVPNEWSKQPDRNVTEPVSERNERYRDFFQGLIDTLREKHHFTKARKASPTNWYAFSTGYGLVKYGANFAMGGRARIELYIDSSERDWNKKLFDHFNGHQTDFESELGGPLEWERLDERKASRIAIVREGSIDDDADTLSEIHDWMVDRLLKFRDVFGPRLNSWQE